MRIGAWMDQNLAIQGYCLGDDERRRLRVGLRFSTGTCLLLVAGGLILQSPAMLLGLAAVGLVAGFGPRHPFDLVWNLGARHVLRAPALPPSPPRRRHAFKVAGAWLLIVAVLLQAGLPALALALGAALVAACSLVTVTNFCVPSFLLSRWERHRARSIVPEGT